MKSLKCLIIIFVFAMTPVLAAKLDSIVIVNGSYGGGWELTAQATGRSLVSLGLITSYRIQTLEGGAGWRALEMFISDEHYKDDLIIQSEPLISVFLKKRYRKGFRDLKPVALIAAEFSCVIVANDSEYKDFSDVLKAINNNLSQVPISLGGRRGMGDHLTAKMIFNAARGKKAIDLRYIFSDGGDKAAIALIKKSKNVIGVTGYNSIITEAVKNKDIRVVGITSSTRVDGYKTLQEQGVDIEYANWRGFFARKDISDERFTQYLAALKTLSQSTMWHDELKANSWSAFFKSGTELTDFLIKHEQLVKETMQDLD